MGRNHTDSTTAKNRAKARRRGIGRFLVGQARQASKAEDVIPKLQQALMMPAWINELRNLEAEAARDPGIEDDHVHETSGAYQAYDRFFASAPARVNAQPLPESWL